MNNSIIRIPSAEESAAYEESTLAFREAQAAVDARQQRNHLLAASDWTQGKDIPDAMSVAWQPYRQALRDITAQDGFPFSVDWPVAPA